MWVMAAEVKKEKSLRFVLRNGELRAVGNICRGLLDLRGWPCLLQLLAVGEGRGTWFATKRPPRALSPALNLLRSLCQSEEDEKLKKRKERFGIVTSSAGAGATEDTEVKAQEVDSSRGDPSAAIGLPLSCCPISPTAVSTAASDSVPAWTQSVRSPSLCSAVPCPGCP